MADDDDDDDIETRFQHLTHTNAIPPDNEYQQIKDVISREYGSLSVLESRIHELQASMDELHMARASIDELQASLDKLHEERAEHFTRIKTLERTASPVRRIPPELVAEIFILICSERFEIPPTPYMAQLVVTHICSGWRQVALELKQIWSRVSLFPPRVYHDEISKLSRSDIELAETWVARAQLCPLDVLMNTESQLKDFADDVLQHIILPRVNQCRSLDLCLSSESLRSFLKLPRPFDLLESLNMKTFFWSPEHFNLDNLALHSVPKLRHLMISNGIFSPRDSSQSSILCAQLTRLHINYGSMLITTLLDVLRKTINLVDCRLCSLIEEDDTSEASLVVLPNLRRLESHMDPGIIQKHLILPELRDLEIGYGIDVDAFVSLASRSAFPLQRLKISHASLQNDDFLRILRCTPHLVMLDLRISVEFTSRLALACLQVRPRLTIVR